MVYKLFYINLDLKVKMPSNRLSHQILDEPLECSLCSKKYYKVEDYFSHLTYQHRRQTLYKCILCPGDKDTLSRYRRHLLGHIASSRRHRTDNIEENIIINDQPNDNNELNDNEDFVELAEIDDMNNDINEMPINSDCSQNIVNNFNEEIKNLKNVCLNNLIQLCSYSDVSFKRAFLTIVQKIDEQKRIFQILTPILNKNDERYQNIMQELNNIYNNFNTKYRFLKYLKELDVYCEPFKYSVGSEIRLITEAGINSLLDVKDSVCHLNIIFMFRKLFEMPNLCNMMLNKINYYLNLNDGKLRNFVQGNIWKGIMERNPNKIIIPYFIYNDDIEVASPIGHNTGKHALCIYTIHFPVLEDYLLAKNEFMFPIAIAKTEDTKKYPKDVILGPLICNQLNSLAKDGIEVLVDGEVKKIYFILGLATGDNKAVNELLGYTGSFIHPMCCRYCLMSRNDRNRMTEENEDLLRKIEDYEEHVETREFGLNRKCLLNELHEYHVYRNSYADIFHDTIYLAIKDGFEAIIQDGIYIKKYTVEDLKRQFNIFDYGQIDSRNRLNQSIFDSKGKLHLTGKEWTVFLKYFTFVLGHYYLNQEDVNIIKYVYILEDLFNICNSDYFDEDKLIKLKQIIKQHHTHFLEHIPLHKTVEENGKLITKIIKQHLKYKHHNHLHFERHIRDSGPLKYLSTMRLESQLRDIKKCATTTNSRVNLPFSVGNRFALKFSLFIQKFNSLDFSYISRSGKSNKFNINEKSYKSTIVHSPINLNSNLTSYSFIDYKGTMFRADNTQFIFMNGNTNAVYKLIEIVEDFDKKENVIYLIVERYTISHFDNHYNAFVLGNSCNIFSVQNIENFGMPFNISTLHDRQKMFKVNKFNFN